MNPEAGQDPADDAIAPMLRMLAQLPPAARERIVHLYVDNAAALLCELGAASASGAPQPLRELSHKLAGAAAMIQDQRLAGLARSMEHHVTVGEVPQALAVWPQLERAAQETLAQLRERFPR